MGPTASVLFNEILEEVRALASKTMRNLVVELLSYAWASSNSQPQESSALLKSPAGHDPGPGTPGFRL